MDEDTYVFWGKVNIDDIDDEILLHERIKLVLEKINQSHGRLIVLLCEEQRTIFKGKKK